MGVKRFVAKTLFGLENVLATELMTLGATNLKTVNRAVLFNGDMELLYRINYCARTALTILLPVAGFRISSKEDLYAGAKRVDWLQFMDNYMTFSIIPVVSSGIFSHTAYPALILKDAIADYFRVVRGRRPNVDTDNPDILINLHISNSQVNISLDSSAVPLYQRGYRTEQGKAPLNEVLAAGILMLSGWNGSVPLSDPMCGSGTILTEAGLIADRIPAGFFRRSFGFMKWKDYNENSFREIKAEADNKIAKSCVPIRGSDISALAVQQTAANINNAGLSNRISLKVIDFKDLKPPEEKGYLVFNPPYGKRVKPEEITDLYRMIGSTLKHKYTGYKAWILTSGKENLNYIGLKPRTKYSLFNGSLQSVLAGYELYTGTKKNPSS